MKTTSIWSESCQKTLMVWTWNKNCCIPLDWIWYIGMPWKLSRNLLWMSWIIFFTGLKRVKFIINFKKTVSWKSKRNNIFGSISRFFWLFAQAELILLILLKLSCCRFWLIAWSSMLRLKSSLLLKMDLNYWHKSQETLPNKLMFKILVFCGKSWSTHHTEIFFWNGFSSKNKMERSLSTMLLSNSIVDIYSAIFGTQLNR